MSGITEKKANSAVPKNSPYRIKDFDGLYLEVRPSGKKVWRFRYSLRGKPGIITFGEYPLISVKEARTKRDEARRGIAEGKRPDHKRAYVSGGAASFEKIAREWFAQKSKEGNKNARYLSSIEGRLRNYVIPEFGDTAIENITPLDLLRLAQKIRDMGNGETSRRVIAICGQIFRYAILLGAVTADPTYALRGALPAFPKGHFASIQDPCALGRFFAAIDAGSSSQTVRFALKFLVLAFPRPGELRHLEWSEVDFDAALIKLPAEKMKMKRPHIIPLAKQVTELLRKQYAVAGRGRYVFPSPRSGTGTRAMSDAALVVAMRNMGYGQDEVCAHGFRHTASTMLNESGLWSPDAIERQLAHAERNKIRGTYNMAEYLDERRKMMQWWADYVCSLANEAKEKITKAKA